MLGMEILAHLYFFLLPVFVRLETRHIRDFGVVISNYACWTFFKMLHLALSQIYTVYFTCGSLSLWTMLRMEILAHLYFSLLRVFARLEMRHTRDFGVAISNYAYWTF